MEPVNEDPIDPELAKAFAKQSAKIETLRRENEWLRSEITRLQDLAFDRAAEIAALHKEEEE
jgi:cell division protein FtsB